MTTKHHTQRVDFGEHGYLEATRDDTDETQDLRLKAFMPDGQQVREHRVLYNIQYDYWRQQEWKAGVLISDEIEAGHGYGHLQWEFSLQPYEGWDEENPYPNNYEPVKKEGCYMFHWEGYKFRALLYENMIDATLNCYIYDDLQEWRKPNLNLITDAYVVTMPHDVENFEECAQEEREELEKTPFDRARAAKKNLKVLRKHGKEIGVPIPYDPRFID